MLSEALQRNAKHEARLSNISDFFLRRIRDHDYWVYILTNKHRNTLYIGITNSIQRRLYQHQCGEVEGFTKRYHLNRLVWLEHFRNVNDAIACEKKLKGWRRSRKIALVEQTNPRWLDLSDDWEQQPNVYGQPWKTEEMIRDSSLRSE
jgi:putative endonuclease